MTGPRTLENSEQEGWVVPATTEAVPEAELQLEEEMAERISEATTLSFLW